MPSVRSLSRLAVVATLGWLVPAGLSPLAAQSSVATVATVPTPTPSPSSSAVAWQPRVGWDNQLFPSFVIATANLQLGGRRLGDSVLTRGDDPNGQVGIVLVAPAAGTEVTVTVSSPGLMEQSRADVMLPVAGTTYTIHPTLAWDYAALGQVHQTRPASVTVQVTVNGVDAPARVVPITLRSVNDCPFLVEGDDAAGHHHVAALWWMFAAYVNENHPLNDRIRREALDAKIVPAFTGYQGGDPQAVVRQVYALWNALQRRGVTYSNITTTAAESPHVRAQQVRFIDQSVGAGQANCVDGSVLFASLLRQVGIDPVLV